MSIIVLQRIDCIWTKKSRGGDAAHVRSVDVFSIGESQCGQLSYIGRYIGFDSGEWEYE
jgi:hypothetical protein